MKTDRLHGRADRVRRGNFKVGEYFIEMRAALSIGLAIGFARRLRELIGADLENLRVEGAVVGEQKGCLRGVVLEQAQLDVLHGQGLEHSIRLEPALGDAQRGADDRALKPHAASAGDGAQPTQVALAQHHVRERARHVEGAETQHVGSDPPTLLFKSQRHVGGVARARDDLIEWTGQAR